MTLAQAVHEQINQIIAERWPESCPNCEPLNPTTLKKLGVLEGNYLTCLRCGRDGVVTKVAHELGDRWVIQRP
jgi:hypothetical protein